MARDNEKKNQIKSETKEEKQISLIGWTAHNAERNFDLSEAAAIRIEK